MFKTDTSKYVLVYSTTPREQRKGKVGKRPRIKREQK